MFRKAIAFFVPKPAADDRALKPQPLKQKNPIDANGRYHREDGKYGTGHEAQAHVRGSRFGAGNASIRIAESLDMSPQELLDLVRRKEELRQDDVIDVEPQDQVKLA